jgi:hypothetical protein
MKSQNMLVWLKKKFKKKFGPTFLLGFGEANKRHIKKVVK